MPLEIKELEIKTHILQNEELGITSEEMEQIVEECIERVIEIMRKRNEW